MQAILKILINSNIRTENNYQRIKMYKSQNILKLIKKEDSLVYFRFSEI